MSVVILLLADRIQQPSPVRRGDDGSVASKVAENQNAMLASAITDSKTSVSYKNKHAALSVESGLSAWLMAALGMYACVDCFESEYIIFPIL
ncbi:MAG: hypothetical protein ACYDCJ_00470 [Gammaproteobacteria bacterium]